MVNLYFSLIAGFLNIVAIPLIIYIATRKGWFDKVNERKIHTGNIPRLGGVGIFWSFAATLALMAAATRMPFSEAVAFWPVAAGMLFIHLLGLWDDFKDLRARIRFFAQVAVAVLVVAFGYRFRTIYVPWAGAVDLGWISYPLSVVWIVGVINALNMIDGLDGLSGGISIIAAFSFGLVFMERGMGVPAAMAVALAGSLAGYLFYNFPPAKIFMGDSGSTFLGFTLAVFPLLDRTGGGGFWFWDGITVLLLPIFDVFAAMIRRSRQGVPLMSPDKWHLHHKLLRLGLGNRAILAILYAICMALGAAAVSVLYLGPILHLIIILASWLALGLFFAVLHYLKEKTLTGEDLAGSGPEIGD